MTRDKKPDPDLEQAPGTSPEKEPETRRPEEGTPETGTPENASPETEMQAGDAAGPDRRSDADGIEDAEVVGTDPARSDPAPSDDVVDEAAPAPGADAPVTDPADAPVTVPADAPVTDPVGEPVAATDPVAEAEPGTTPGLTARDPFAEMPERGSYEDAAATATPWEDTTGSEAERARDHAAGAAEEDHAAAAPAPQQEPHHEDEEEDDGPSLAARVLTWLVIFILGGVLALWAGPKVAPHLPSGLAPVAAWLTPGSESTETAIAALRSDLEAEISAIQPGLQADAVEKIVSDQVTAAMGQVDTGSSSAVEALQQQVTALSDKVNGSDSGDIEARLSTVETRSQGLSADLNTLKTELAGLDTTSGAGSLSEENAAQIAAFASTVQGLKAETDTLSGRVGQLSQKIDEVAAANERRNTEAQQRAAEAEANAAAERRQVQLTNAVAAIGAALDDGTPIAAPVAQIKALGGTVPAALDTAAQQGVPTLKQLDATFQAAAIAAIRADTKAQQGEGILLRAEAFFRSQVASRSLTEQTGDDVDAILSRIEARMSEDDLAAAITEAETLPAEAKAELADWISAAERRRDALQAYAELRQSQAGN